MSFNADFLRAEAIREVRASGCTLPGVAELIVEHHGASAVLANTSRIQALGEEVAASDTETGAKMRRLLLQMSTKTGTAAAMTKKDGTKSSMPSESKAAVAATAGATTGSASDAAAGADASGEAAAAAGNSAAESESAA